MSKSGTFRTNHLNSYKQCPTRLYPFHEPKFYMNHFLQSNIWESAADVVNSSNFVLKNVMKRMHYTVLWRIL